MSNLRVIVSALLKFVFPHQEYLVWKYTKMSAWAQGHSRSSVLVIVMLHLQDLECSAQQISAQRVWVSGPEAREACAGPPWPSAHLVPSSSRDPPAPCPPQPPSSSCELCPGWGCPQRLSPAALAHSRLLGTSFGQGGSASDQTDLWSAARSYHGSTSQSWFQFHFPLAQRGVS